MKEARSQEFKNFDAAIRKIFSVSHDELKRREEDWKNGRKVKGRKRVKA